MCPVLFESGNIMISGYWGMTMLAILFSCTYIILENRHLGKQKIPGYHIYNMICVCILSIYIGGALMGVLVNLPEFIGNWQKYQGSLLKLWNAAFEQRAFYGGIIMVAVMICCYAKVCKLDGQSIVKLFVPATPLFMVFGRLGCFMGGCCYGVPVSWGMVFPEGSLAPAGVPLFPSQLLEAFVNFLIFLLLHRMTKRVKNAYDLILIYIVCYGVSRFFLEYGRGDIARGGFWIFSTSQWVSLALVSGVLAIQYIRKRRNEK